MVKLQLRNPNDRIEKKCKFEVPYLFIYLFNTKNYVGNTGNCQLCGKASVHFVVDFVRVLLQQQNFKQYFFSMVYFCKFLA